MAAIGVDFQEAPGDVEEFGKKYSASFPLAIEDEERAKKAFGILGCPATAIVDRDGRIVGRSGGEGDWTSESARVLVRSLLGIQPAASAATGAGTKQKVHKTVHLISAVADDSKLNEMLDEAARSLAAGDRVSILFDGQSVGALRTSGRKTTLEGVQLNTKRRNRVARMLNIPESAAPKNQFEYIQQLAKQGAAVLVNTNAMRALGLADAEIHPIAKRVSVGEMEKIVEDSDACLTYTHD